MPTPVLEKHILALAEQELSGIDLEIHEGRTEAALQHYHAVKTLATLVENCACALAPDIAAAISRISNQADALVSEASHISPA
ncbi:hypothetical protein PS623_04698 [Pseudomonas fluorescens]|uniref:hypothetical protein n=1 Tax=Pseudomonas fluorescens TaxID=294 RepID=UPI001240B790|nr:hypothetical protein [Pseudomonas fluorescens]VVN29255.1 hypothetical protein PS623_04698 [Pseudomonas fluorescens]